MATKNGTFVALLRGINVGGKNSLSMKDLVGMFERAGCVTTRHYIQSGNIVFSAPAALAVKVPAVVAAAIAKDHGLGIPVVLRSEQELRAVVRGNPFLKAGADPDTLHVMFLADQPSKAAVAALDPARSPPDELVVKGREVYLMCPNGVGRSKLTNAWLDAKLATVSTARNWRTVLKLVAMCDE